MALVEIIVVMNVVTRGFETTRLGETSPDSDSYASVWAPSCLEQEAEPG